MPPEFLTRYAGVFLDVHIFPPKRHSNFQSVGIPYWINYWTMILNISENIHPYNYQPP